MLHYFRINDPYRLIGLLVVLLILYLPFVLDMPGLTYPELKSMIIGEKISGGFALYTGIIDTTAPFTGWLYAASDMMLGKSLLGRHILAFIILFIEAVFLGMIFIDKRAFPENSFIPSLIFGILCAFSFDTLSLGGELFATLFILIALNSLFKEIESREESFEMVLKTGVFVGISSLFEFSFIVYLFASLLILILYTRSSGRKILLLVIGFAIPHLLLISIYSINGGIADLWNFFYLANLSITDSGYINTSGMLYLLAIPLVFFIGSLLLLNRESRFTKYQSQLFQAMFFWSLFSILQVYYSKEFRPQSFLPVMIGLSYFISHFFSILIRRKFAEISFWIFLAGIVSVSYMSRYGTINQGVYKNLMVETKTNPVGSGKKIVVLSDAIALYNGNQLSTPFFNWDLSGHIFKEPEFYDNIVKIHNGFQGDTPDIIIDPQDLMKPFFAKIPLLRKQYVRTDVGYQKKK